jgi:cell pole-organizing protein PopZ
MANPQHEPTMEEILASIRKIISDDASSTTTVTPVVSQPEHAHSEPEVLDLTHEVADPAPAPHLAAEADPKPEEDHSAAPHCDTPAEATAEPATETAAMAETDAGLFSEKARQALSDAMSGIGAETPEPQTETHAETHTVTAVGVGGLSVEAVFERAVKDSFDPVVQKWLVENNDALLDRMKPVIRDWLDENFPALLEDAIRNELARTKPRARR